MSDLLPEIAKLPPPLDAREFYAPPSIWQRIAWWDRWPWHEKTPAKLHDWSAPWVTIARRNGRIVGWHHDQEHPWGFGVIVNRWSCLFGLITGRLNFDFEHFDMTTPPDEGQK